MLREEEEDIFWAGDVKIEGKLKIMIVHKGQL